MNLKSYFRGERRSGFRRAALIAFAALAVLGVLFGSQLVGLYVDWLWFADAGYRNVFTRTTLIKGGLLLAASAIFFTIVYSNLWLARRISPRPRLFLDEQHQFRINVGDISRQGATLVVLIAALVVSLSVGMGAASGWYNYLLFANPVEFGQSDPVFGRDIGYYVFTFPFWRYIYRWVMLAVVLSFVGTAALYFVDRAIDFVGGREGVRVEPRVRVHLSVLVGLGLILKAWGYWLARYEVLFSSHGLFFGAGYTDVKVRLVVLTALVALVAVAGLIVIATSKARGFKAPVVAIGTWLVVAFVGGALVPGTVQKMRVTPNELSAEQPYITHNIKATRDAYNLDKVVLKDFPAAGNLRGADIQANQDTIESIRLWDYEPLLEAYRQLQTIRAYYTFRGADTDRYRFPEGLRQVALSVREMDVNKLGGAESSWINRHLIYTHGYGLSMSPVNRVAGDGLPELIIRDFPPVTPTGMALTQPQIYFGEMTGDYVIVNTTEKEFDRPAGDENVTTRYEGSPGVALAGLGRRLAFAAHFADLNLLISPAITGESRILFGRSIGERVQRLAPFLRLDSDPYPVVHNGRVVWIVDAYTTSPWYPYSQRMALPNADRVDSVVSYMRNSVKVTVDAYDGTVFFYMVDPTDPIAASLQKAFPALYRPLADMPKDLREHLRYPTDLFNYQATIYAGYHMNDARLFYNREDMWQIPRIQSDEKSTTGLDPQEPMMRPYYMIMRLPGEEKAEYILMLPFTPYTRTGEKQNMIAWMAARSDPDRLGELIVYRFPKQKLVYGPNQVKALANQDPQISEKLSLWSRSGSQVIFGPVMVIPIEDSVIYVTPLYLRSVNSQMPALKKVLLTYGNHVEMADTLEQGLTTIFGRGGARPAAVVPAPTSAPAASGTAASRPAATGEIRGLAREADEQYRRAQEALRGGDWTAYGAEMKRLEETLRRLRRLSEE